MTDGLVAFLNARIDEDEVVACGWRYWLPVKRRARLIREVEAKRRITAEHKLVQAGDRFEEPTPGEVGCWTCHVHEFGTDAEGPCRTLLLLAAVYSDHPDYRDEWAS